ncbi:hypothetical protein CNMCM5793_005618 [Aspergillus hiratsukae]|uniref:Uncharacterized protein n=1 Tax=Aspergillus hiratsukae TaxID=1194566 RepID=A0A8H6Q6F9_9EURO|nr:hypothetical protein CNMCM5793_005618 [Aspergillus hiratsukae]KAF7166569.1 hypothetical protein CNMCM6106_002344 [Aspergillus hiratsukae]
MNSVQEIIDAATVLSRIEYADRQDLLSHRQELESAFMKLRALLQPVTPAASSPATILNTSSGSDTCAALEHPQVVAASSPPPAPVVPATPAVPDASNALPATPRPPNIPSSPASAAHNASPAVLTPSSHNSDEANHFPGPVLDLMESLTKYEGQITPYLQQRPASAVFSGKDWASEDPRIVDISQLDKKTATPDAKFRSILSALSLEHGYTEWERPHRRARVDCLLEDLNSASGGRRAAYKEYVDNFSDRFRDKAKARKYIEYGVKFNVFGKIYSALAKVSSSVHVHTPLDTHLGVIGILSFVFHKFRHLQYSQLPMLAKAILMSKWTTLAESKCQWMSECIQHYHARIQNILQAQKHALVTDDTEQRKRRRLLDSPNDITLPHVPLLPLPDLIPLEQLQNGYSETLFQGAPAILRHQESVERPSLSQDTPSVALPDLIPLELPQNISFEDPSLLQRTADIPEPIQNTSFQHPSIRQDTPSIPLPDLVPLEVAGLPQDIDSEVRRFLSNLNPESCVGESQIATAV